MIIDGKKTAAELREKLKIRITELKSTYNAVPGLTVILVGEDPPSKIYVKNKEKFAKEVGMNSEVIKYPADLEEKELLNKITRYETLLDLYEEVSNNADVVDSKVLFIPNQEVLFQTNQNLDNNERIAQLKFDN